jgi:hypothetical protein
VKCPEDTNKIPTYPSQVRWWTEFRNIHRHLVVNATHNG